MNKPQCAICQCIVTSGRCWVCSHCREEFSLGTRWSELPEWVRFLVHEEQKRRRVHKVEIIDFSDLCYCDRLKVEQVIGEQQDAD